MFIESYKLKMNRKIIWETFIFHGVKGLFLHFVSVSYFWVFISKFDGMGWTVVLYFVRILCGFAYTVGEQWYGDDCRFCCEKLLYFASIKNYIIFLFIFLPLFTLILLKIGNSSILFKSVLRVFHSFYLINIFG